MISNHYKAKYAPQNPVDMSSQGFLIRNVQRQSEICVVSAVMLFMIQPSVCSHLCCLTRSAVSCLCRCYRDLDARAKNERYRTMFRLTQDERLDGHTDCTLWTPFAKMHVVGQLFISNNYICFNSREEDLCQLIIPLREVNSCCHLNMSL